MIPKGVVDGVVVVVVVLVVVTTNVIRAALGVQQLFFCFLVLFFTY